MAARPVRGAGPRRVRPDRARGRQRRGRHPHARGARRGCGRVGDRRREGVHHQLGHPDHEPRSPSPPAPTPADRSRPRSARSSCPPAPRASRCSRRTARWAGTRPTRTASPSRAAACPRPTCSEPAGAASPTSSPPSTTGASPSPRSRSAPSRPASSTRCAYAKDRHAFGKPIGSYQAVAFKCADLAVMAATARTLVYEAAWRKDTGRPFKQHAAMAKLYATEAAVTATREATQIFGGYGFIDETAVSSVLPRLQDPRDRRGHERDPAPRDQPRARPRRRFLTRPPATVERRDRSLHPPDVAAAAPHHLQRRLHRRRALHRRHARLLQRQARRHHPDPARRRHPPRGRGPSARGADQLPARRRGRRRRPRCRRPRDQGSRRHRRRPHRHDHGAAARPEGHDRPAAVVPPRPVGAHRGHGHEAPHQRGVPGQRAGRRAAPHRDDQAELRHPDRPLRAGQLRVVQEARRLDRRGAHLLRRAGAGPELWAQHPLRRTAGRSTAPRRSPSPGPARTTRSSGTASGSSTRAATSAGSTASSTSSGSR